MRPAIGERQRSLPPDINWGVLPPEVERRLKRLTRLPDGYVRIVIGADVAILHTRTRMVIDLLEGIGD